MSFGNEREFIDLQQLEERRKQAMKCPLRIFVVQQGLEVGTGYMPDCLKEECAWWDESQGRCAIKEIALCLEYISTDLTKLVEKMPHAGQFTK